MDKLFSINLGTPKHGWLPVDFSYNEFHLDFAASDGLNNPIEELFDSVIKLKDNEVKRTTWWLEPGAYFFDFERKGQSITLAIIEIADLHDERTEKTQLITIIGEDKKILEPFRVALKQFSSQSYEEKQGQFNLAKNKISSL